MDTRIKRTYFVTTGTYTTTGNVTTTLTTGSRLCHVSVHYDAGTAVDCTVSLDANEGTNYDTVLATADNSAGGMTDNFIEFGDGAIFESGDNFIVTSVGSLGVNAYVRIVTEAI